MIELDTEAIPAMTSGNADVARLLGALIVAGAAADMVAARVQAVDVLALASMNVAQVAEALSCSAEGAERVVLVFALHRRLLSAQAPERPTCKAPEDVAALLRPFALVDCERLWVLPLDPRCRVVGGEPVEVYRGDVDGTDAGPRAIIRAALRAGASSVIVAHNHPTGDATPSTADVAVTSRLVAAGRAVDVQVVDHVIVTAYGGWFSFRRDRPDLFR